ncbi:hypothetical protein [Asaia sp. As-1742]|uniref:hypothetical protein n=1 Tax=Asaia sp. As-1742 TaxID=2608325 RepID=UPI001421C5E8|nr:hypothetical protein [Asaia sp. As-1742]NIE81633.1 hypothetical protein [Asaia sp. As-1742]
MMRDMVHKWRIPGLIFLTTPVALLAALLIDGIMGDIAGACALGLPLGVTIWFIATCVKR